jgi:hypothetical protein
MATNPQSNYFGIGLGGMIRRPHVRELLKEMGNQLREAQILGIGLESYSSEVSPVTTAQYASTNSKEQATRRKRLRKEEDISTFFVAQGCQTMVIKNKSWSRKHKGKENQGLGSSLRK